MASQFSSTKSIRVNSQSPLMLGMAVTQGVEGPASKGLTLASAMTKVIKSSGSSLESLMIPRGGALDSSSARAKAIISSCKGVVAEDGVVDGAMGDTGARDNDTKGEDKGEALADCQANPQATGERLAVFILMTINVEMLSGSNPTLRCLLLKPRPG